MVMLGCVIVGCSHDAEHLHHDGRANVTEEHGQHEKAECAAEEDAEDAVDLGEEFWSN